MRMDAKQEILTRLLPKTGQIISYHDYDDGYYHKGWWQNRSYADNKLRFIAKTIDGDDVVIDRATGLMWAADGNEAGCMNGNTASWSVVIVYPDDFIFAEFRDWRVPNVNELASIIDYSHYQTPWYETLFPNTKDAKYWTATSGGYLGTNGWIVDFFDGTTYLKTKSDTWYLRCVRSI